MIDITSLFAISLLFISAAALWVPYWKSVPIFVLTLILAVVLGVASQHIEPLGLLLIVILAALLYSLRLTARLSIKCGTTLVIIAISLGFFTHSLPGFNNILLYKQLVLTPDAMPFSLYLNFDKTIAGILILGLLHQRANTYAAWKKILGHVIPLTFLLAAILFSISYQFHYVKFEPKLVSILPLWLLTNLLFTCMAEEALFRGFIQYQLMRLLKNVRGNSIWAVGLSAIIFGALHFQGGFNYVILATVAGIGYGWIYQKTRYIESSILLHFLINTIQILFFTYPALVSV